MEIWKSQTQPGTWVNPGLNQRVSKLLDKNTQQLTALPYFGEREDNVCATEEVHTKQIYSHNAGVENDRVRANKFPGTVVRTPPIHCWYSPWGITPYGCWHWDSIGLDWRTNDAWGHLTWSEARIFTHGSNGRRVITRQTKHHSIINNGVDARPGEWRWVAGDGCTLSQGFVDRIQLSINTVAREALGPERYIRVSLSAAVKIILTDITVQTDEEMTNIAAQSLALKCAVDTLTYRATMAHWWEMPLLLERRIIGWLVNNGWAFWLPIQPLVLRGPLEFQDKTTRLGRYPGGKKFDYLWRLIDPLISNSWMRAFNQEMSMTVTQQAQGEMHGIAVAIGGLAVLATARTVIRETNLTRQGIQYALAEATPFVGLLGLYGPIPWLGSTVGASLVAGAAWLTGALLPQDIVTIKWDTVRLGVGATALAAGIATYLANNTKVREPSPIPKREGSIVKRRKNTRGYQPVVERRLARVNALLAAHKKRRPRLDNPWTRVDDGEEELRYSLNNALRNVGADSGSEEELEISQPSSPPRLTQPPTPERQGTPEVFKEVKGISAEQLQATLGTVGTSHRNEPTTGLASPQYVDDTWEDPVNPKPVSATDATQRSPWVITKKSYHHGPPYCYTKVPMLCWANTIYEQKWFNKIPNDTQRQLISYLSGERPAEEDCWGEKQDPRDFLCVEAGMKEQADGPFEFVGWFGNEHWSPVEFPGGTKVVTRYTMAGGAETIDIDVGAAARVAAWLKIQTVPTECEAVPERLKNPREGKLLISHVWGVAGSGKTSSILAEMQGDQLYVCPFRNIHSETCAKGKKLGHSPHQFATHIIALARVGQYQRIILDEACTLPSDYIHTLGALGATEVKMFGDPHQGAWLHMYGPMIHDTGLTRDGDLNITQTYRVGGPILHALGDLYGQPITGDPKRKTLLKSCQGPDWKPPAGTYSMAFSTYTANDMDCATVKSSQGITVDNAAVHITRADLSKPLLHDRSLWTIALSRARCQTTIVRWQVSENEIPVLKPEWFVAQNLLPVLPGTQKAPSTQPDRTEWWSPLDHTSIQNTKALPAPSTAKYHKPAIKLTRQALSDQEDTIWTIGERHTLMTMKHRPNTFVETVRARNTPTATELATEVDALWDEFQRYYLDKQLDNNEIATMYNRVRNDFIRDHDFKDEEIVRYTQLRHSVKAQTKKTSKFKPGQPIRQHSEELLAQVAIECRLAAMVLARRLKPQFKLGMFETDRELLDWLTKNMQGDIQALDFASYDASQNAATSHIEGCFLARLTNTSEQFWQIAPLRQHHRKAQDKYGSFWATGVKASGEPGTLITNTITAMILCMKAMRPKGGMFKGDDAILRSTEPLVDTFSMPEADMTVRVEWSPPAFTNYIPIEGRWWIDGEKLIEKIMNTPTHPELWGEQVVGWRQLAQDTHPKHQQALHTLLQYEQPPALYQHARENRNDHHYTPTGQTWHRGEAWPIPRKKVTFKKGGGRVGAFSNSQDSLAYMAFENLRLQIDSDGSSTDTTTSESAEQTSCRTTVWKHARPTQGTGPRPWERQGEREQDTNTSSKPQRTEITWKPMGLIGGEDESDGGDETRKLLVSSEHPPGPHRGTTCGCDGPLNTTVDPALGWIPMENPSGGRGGSQRGGKLHKLLLQKDNRRKRNRRHAGCGQVPYERSGWLAQVITIVCCCLCFGRVRGDRIYNITTHRNGPEELAFYTNNTNGTLTNTPPFGDHCSMVTARICNSTLANEYCVMIGCAWPHIKVADLGQFWTHGLPLCWQVGSLHWGWTYKDQGHCHDKQGAEVQNYLTTRSQLSGRLGYNCHRNNSGRFRVAFGFPLYHCENYADIALSAYPRKSGGLTILTGGLREMMEDSPTDIDLETRTNLPDMQPSVKQLHGPLLLVLIIFWLAVKKRRRRLLCLLLIGLGLYNLPLSDAVSKKWNKGTTQITIEVCVCESHCSWSYTDVAKINAHTGEVVLCVANGWSAASGWGSLPAMHHLRSIGVEKHVEIDHTCSVPECNHQSDTVHHALILRETKVYTIDWNTEDKTGDHVAVKMRPYQLAVPKVLGGRLLYCSGLPPFRPYVTTRTKSNWGPTGICDTGKLPPEFSPDCMETKGFYKDWFERHCDNDPGEVMIAASAVEKPHCEELCGNSTHKRSTVHMICTWDTKTFYRNKVTEFLGQATPCDLSRLEGAPRDRTEFATTGIQGPTWTIPGFGFGGFGFASFLMNLNSVGAALLVIVAIVALWRLFRQNREHAVQLMRMAV